MILEILIGAVIAYAIGIVWYSPLLFFKPWSKYTKMTKKNMKVGPMTFVLQGVGAIFISMALVYLNPLTLLQGIQLGFVAWIGFVVPVNMGPVLWQKQPWGLFWINSGYVLVQAVVIGAVIGLW